MEEGEVSDLERNMASNFIQTDLYKRVPMKNYHHKSKESLERLFRI